MVTPSDFNTHIYAEIIESISREDEDILQTAIGVAEERVKASMGRFDIATLFSATGTSRSPYLMNLIKDLAAWEFIALASTNLNYEFWRERRDDAEKQLEKIEAGKRMPVDWPLVESPRNPPDFFDVVNTSPRRNTRY